MTKEREALKMALEALGKAKRQIVNANVAPHGCISDAIAAIEEALAQAKQEPVGWMDGSGNVFIKYPGDDYVPPYTPLYSLPQREWVGLTDGEIQELRLKSFDAIATNYEIYRAIEAKLKEKNHENNNRQST